MIYPHSRLLAVPILSVMLLITGICGLLHPDWLAMGAVESAVVLRGEWYRLITAIFLHLNGLHLWLNVMLLWLIGVPLEKQAGSKTVLALFFVGGLAGNGLHGLLETSHMRAVGASTGIYALLGAEIVGLHQARTRLSRLERMYLFGLVALAGGGIVLGLIVNTLPLPIQAGNAGHIGGLLAGLAGGWIMHKRAPESAG